MKNPCLDAGCGQAEPLTGARGDEEGRNDLGCYETQCTKCAPKKLEQCDKLLVAGCGEVAERLNAAVC